MNSNTLTVGSALQGGRYRMVKVLGQGGFGITYLAEQTGLGRRVAVKEFFMKDLCNRDGDTSIVSVPSEGSRELVDRYRAKFVKEARLIASLNNQRIIKIHDVFEENGTAYYVMDYLPGGSVSDLLSKTGDLSLNTALKYTRQIGEALNYIHSRPDPLNHLDVKPSNIMLDDNGDAVLVDFGLSKRYDAGGHQTSSTPVGVSHGYAPLEQYKDGGVKEFSPTTDIYSLGATLYKMLTGATPPHANDVFEEGLPPMPDFIPANIRSAIEKAMQPSKKDRPKSVVEFLNLLDGMVKEDDNEDTVLSGSKSNGKKNGDNQRKSKVPKEEKEKKHFPFLKLLTDFAAFELFQIVVFFLISFASDGKVDAVVLSVISCFYTVVGCVLLRKYEFWSKQFRKHLLFWYIIYFVIIGSIICYTLIDDNYLDTFAVFSIFAPTILLFAMAICDFFKNRRRKEKKPAESELLEKSQKQKLLEKSNNTGLPKVIGCVLVVIAAFCIVLFSLKHHDIQPQPSTTGFENGHEWVDLGLSVKWASCNVGASKPSDYGGYFACGETMPMRKSKYTLSYIVHDNWRLGAFDNKGTLRKFNDAAHTNWGGKWHTPTNSELQELIDNCIWTWTTLDGHEGYNVISKTNGNSIFLPAAGHLDFVTREYDNSSSGVGNYWSSSHNLIDYAFYLSFGSRGMGLTDGFIHYHGRSVRPVCK